MDRENFHPVVIALCEHWLSPECAHMANRIKNFNLVDIYCRSTSKHGGVCILVRKDVEAFPIPELRYTYVDFSFECVAVKFELTINGSDVKYIVISIYRTPDSSFVDFIQRFDTFLLKLNKRSKNNNIFICGDFNINLLKDDAESRTFFNLLKRHNFRTIFSEATRKTPSSNTCIDNILTNVKNNLYEGKTRELGFSDHCALFLNIYGKELSRRKIVVSRMFKNASRIHRFTQMLIAEDWSSCLLENTSTAAFNIFFKKFHFAFLNAFPPKTTTVYLNDRRSVSSWITPGIKKSSETKRKLFQLTKTNSNPEFLLYFKKYAKIFRKTVKAAKRMCNSNLISNSKNVTATAWKIVKQEAGLVSSPEVCSSLVVDGRTIKDPIQIADCFNEGFSSFASTNIGPIALTDSIKCICNMEQVKAVFKFHSVTENKVKKVIDSFANKESTGWDEIPMSLVKATSAVITRPLTHIINLVLKTGIYPKKLKYTVICPIFKKGDRMNLNDYRPIALLPAFSKVIEKIVFEQVREYFESKNLLNRCQFGFRKGRSTKMAVFELVNEVLTALDHSESALGVFCDLSKAFDCVRHNLLLRKLELYGLRDTSRKFFETYLEDRYQQVKLRDSSGNVFFSGWRRVSCGVPQGSLLGPLLFLVFVNDLPCSVKSKLVLFADDTTAIIRAKSVSEMEKKGEAAIDTLDHWFKANGLKLNHSKTNMLRFRTTNRDINDEGIRMARIGVCDTVRSVDFLGVSVDCLLRWDSHIDSLRTKLNRALYVLSTLAHVVGTEILLKVYHGYFMAHVNYSVLFWGSSRHCSTILKLQKRALRVVFKLKARDSCRPYFRDFKLMTVPAVYIYELLSFMKKYYFYFSNAESRHQYFSRNSRLMNYPIHRLTLLERGPYYMAIKCFNNLPDVLKADFKNDNFQKVLKEYLLNLRPYSMDDYITPE
jgi:exonuclease III